MKFILSMTSLVSRCAASRNSVGELADLVRVVVEQGTGTAQMVIEVGDAVAHTSLLGGGHSAPQMLVEMWTWS